MIDEADRDRDGEPNEEEFLRIMKKTNPSSECSSETECLLTWVEVVAVLARLQHLHMKISSLLLSVSPVFALARVLFLKALHDRRRRADGATSRVLTIACVIESARSGDRAPARAPLVLGGHLSRGSSPRTSAACREVLCPSAG